MNSIILLAIGLCAVNAQLQPTPVEQYAALLKEYNAAAGRFRSAQSDNERKEAVEQLDLFPQKFIALAGKFPDDPVALKALRQAVQAVGSVDSLAQHAWEMNHTSYPTGSNPETAKRIVKLLLRDHIESDALGPVIDRMRWGYRMDYANFLRRVMQLNSDRKVQAWACLSLAQFLNDRLQMLRLIEDRPELKKRYQVIFGEDYSQKLHDIGPTAFQQQIEALLQQAIQYDDVPAPLSGSIAEQAKRALYGLKHLTVGKAAPEIDGVDQDGKSFKLSEYRGKVVLLYFWMEL